MFLSSCEKQTGIASDASSRSAEKIRVACVGDSITFGEGIKDRQKDSYPAQLGALLGEGWDVRNFGVNSVTVVKSDYPYYKTQAYVDTLAFLPQVVLIHLGTNDALPYNWRKKDDFIKDYRSLIKSFRKLASKPRIVLCMPVPAYRGGGDADPMIQNEIIPCIQAIAQKMGLAVVDLNSVFLGKTDLFNEVHPNERGAKLMAETIYTALIADKVKQ